MLSALSEGGQPGPPPNAGAPWLEARLTVRAEDHRETFAIAVVPSRRLVRAGNARDGWAWLPISAEAAGRIGAAGRRLGPFPASELEGVGPTEARVYETILPPDGPEPSSSATPWGWILAGLAAVALAAALVARRARPARGLPRLPPAG
jgi:hypothetical protein